MLIYNVGGEYQISTYYDENKHNQMTMIVTRDNKYTLTVAVDQSNNTQTSRTSRTIRRNDLCLKVSFFGDSYTQFGSTSSLCMRSTILAKRLIKWITMDEIQKEYAFGLRKKRWSCVRISVENKECISRGFSPHIYMNRGECTLWLVVYENYH